MKVLSAVTRPHAGRSRTGSRNIRLLDCISEDQERKTRPKSGAPK